VTVGKLGMWKVCNVVWVWFAAVLRCIGECGHCGGCEYVFFTGACRHHAMQRGESVLELACKRGYRDIVEACLDRGAPLDVAGVSVTDRPRL
jgi:hypothetical protein